MLIEDIWVNNDIDLLKSGDATETSFTMSEAVRKILFWKLSLSILYFIGNLIYCSKYIHGKIYLQAKRKYYNNLLSKDITLRISLHYLFYYDNSKINRFLSQKHIFLKYEKLSKSNNG